MGTQQHLELIFISVFNETFTFIALHMNPHYTLGLAVVQILID